LAYNVQLNYIVLIGINALVFCLWKHFWNFTTTHASFLLWGTEEMHFHIFFSYGIKEWTEIWGECCWFCALRELVQLGWCLSCALVPACFARKLRWFLDVNSGVLHRVEGIFGLVVIDFVRLLQLIWKFSVFRFPANVETHRTWVGSLLFL